MTIRCDWCGLFCRVVDEYTNFGGPEDMEPPDPILLCAKCAKALEDEVAATKYPHTYPVPWRLAAAHYAGIKRAGLVLVHYPHTAWEASAWPDAIPKDMVPVRETGGVE